MIEQRRKRTALGLALCAGIAGALVAVTALRAARGRGANEEAATRLARSRVATGDREGALAGLLACAAEDPHACACADDGAALAIDLGRYPDALRAIERADCPASPRHRGGRAEAFATNGHVLEATNDADAALAQDPREPHACFARAWALGSGAEAKTLAERAVDGGRGVPALLLLGTLRLTDNDLAGAQAAFEQASQQAPKDARAAFDVGFVAQREGRFRDAREGYLRALAVDPNMADARYNLALLTHAVGANDEARHDLEELERIAPGDPRIGALRATLGK